MRNVKKKTKINDMGKRPRAAAKKNSLKREPPLEPPSRRPKNEKRKKLTQEKEGSGKRKSRQFVLRTRSLWRPRGLREKSGFEQVIGTML